MPGFNFRDSSGFVTDGSGESAVVSGSLAYPTTFSNGVTAGWEAGPEMQSRDNDNTVDRRFAGVHFIDPGHGSQRTWRIDLASSGTYDIRLAQGHYFFPSGDDYLEILDTSNTLSTPIDDSNGHTEDQWYDATGVLRTSIADWVSNNAAATLAFSTTIMRFAIGRASGSAGPSPVAHIFFESIGSVEDISGSVAGVALVTGSLTGLGDLSGATSGLADATGNALAVVLASGTSDGQASTTAILTGLGSLSGATGGAAMASALLTALGALSGTTVGSATVSGSLGALAYISGSTSGLAIATGRLSVEGEIEQIIQNVLVTSKPFAIIYFTPKSLGNLIVSSY